MIKYTLSVLKWNTFAKKQFTEPEAEEFFRRVFREKATLLKSIWDGLDKDWDAFFQEINQENRETLLSYVLDH